MSIIIGGRYRHYKKGNEYIVRGIAQHSETGETLVIYEMQYETDVHPLGTWWARPKSMFEELVEYEGRMVPRFQYIEKEKN